MEEASFVKFQHQMTMVFLGCLFLGTLVTFVHPWLPVVFVIVYFIIGMQATRSQRNSERFADSLYYLGFLLTLVALLNATLGDKVTEEIVKNLGTGLSTTLVGLGLRVIVLQFRETVSDQEEEGQVALEKEIALMVENFSKLTHSITGFHKQFTEEAEKLVQGVRAARKSLDEGGKQIAELPSVLERSIHPAAERIASRLDAVQVTPDLIAKRLDAAISPLAAALSRGADEMHKGVLEVRQRLEGATRSLSNDSAAISEAIRAARKGIEEALAHLARLPTETRTAMAETVGELNEKLRAIDFDSSVAKQRAVVSSMEELTKVLHAVAGRASEVGEVLGLLRGSAEAIDKAISGAAASSEKMSDAVSEIAPASSRLVDELGALHGAAHHLRNTVDETKRGMAGATQDIGSLRQDVAGVREATSRLVEFATKELKP